MKKFSSTTKGSSRRTFLNSPGARVAAAGLMLVLVLMFVPSVLRYASALVLLPVVKFEHWVAESGSALPTYLRDRSALLANERDLRQQLAEHAAARLTAERLRQENGDLRALLSATTTDRMAAAVIGRPTALPYDVFVIDKGSRDGVVDNAPVYLGTDQVIGFVAYTTTHTAVVALVTTPNFKSTVYIYGPNIYTTAVGMGAGSLRVNVPQGIALAEGDLVVIPSLQGGIYGEITVVDSVASRPEQYGYVSIEEPLAGIRYVSVGQAPLETISFEAAKEIVETIRTDILQVPVPSGVLVDVASGTSTASTTVATTTDDSL